MSEMGATATTKFVFFSFLLCSFAISCYGVSFSSLPRCLVISASPTQGQVLKAGEDEINVSWSYNTTFEKGRESLYKTINIKLCYAPISQKDRAWRKTVDTIAKDKTCQFNIVVDKPFTPSNNNTFTWTIKKEVPTATYFVRAFVYNSDNQEIGFGQTTDAKRTTNLFEIQAISGRHASIDIAAICFSVFSVVSLAGFFLLEKRKASKAA